MSSDADPSVRIPCSPLPIGREESLPPTSRKVENDQANLMSCERCRTRKKKECAYLSAIECFRYAFHVQRMVKNASILLEDRERLATSIRKKAEVAELRARCLELEAKLDRMTRESVLLRQQQLSYPPTHPQSSTQSFHVMTPTANSHTSSPYAVSPRYSLPRIRSSPPTLRTGLSLVERAVLRMITKEHDSGQSVRGNIGRQLGTTSDDASHLSAENENTSIFPRREGANMLVNRYFDFSYGVVPFVSRRIIDQDVAAVYPDDVIVPDIGSLDKPNIHVFRLAAVFIITSGRLDDQERQLYRPDTTTLHSLMAKHLPAAFQAEDLACLECVALLAVVAILVFVTSSPYEVTGIAVAMAMEMKLHEENPDLDPAEQEERRRVFWSIFLVDRVVSTHMTRPVAVPESIISVRLPGADMGGMTTQADDMSPSDFFRHLVLMRRLNGIMLEKINLAAQILNPDELFTELRNQIDDWWNNVTSSFSTIVPPSSFHTSRHPFFELNYNLFLVHLYRPSRLFSQTTPMRIPILRSASSRAIELYWELYDRRRVPQNYVQLNNIVVLSVSLLYAVGENEGDPRNLDIGSWRQKALADLNRCEKLLAGFCVGWPDVQRFREAFGQLSMSVKGRLIRSNQPSSLPPWSFPPPSTPLQATTTPTGGICSTDGMGNLGGVTDWTEVTDFGTIDVEAFLSSVGLSDWTSGA